jgi:hypothetical protein
LKRLNCGKDKGKEKDEPDVDRRIPSVKESGEVGFGSIVLRLVEEVETSNV